MNNTEFAAQYGTQLAATRKMISQLQELIHIGKIHDNIQIAALTRIENIYDKFVLKFIDYSINVYNLHVSVTDICNKALANYQGTGTEPQFVLYAINDVYQYIMQQTKLDNLFPSGI